MTMNNRVEELPLPCIRLLDKFIKNVYLGKIYNLNQFQ